MRKKQQYNNNNKESVFLKSKKFIVLSENVVFLTIKNIIFKLSSIYC